MEPSPDVICAEELWTEGPSEQTLAAAGKATAEMDVRPQQESPMSSSFREVQELLEVGQLIQVSLAFWQVLKTSLFQFNAFFSWADFFRVSSSGIPQRL